MIKYSISLVTLFLILTATMNGQSEEDEQNRIKENYERFITYYNEFGPNYPRVPDGVHSGTLVKSDHTMQEFLVLVEHGKVISKIIKQHKFYDQTTLVNSHIISEGKTQLREGTTYFNFYFIKFLETGQTVSDKLLMKNDTLELFFNNRSLFLEYSISGEEYVINRSNINRIKEIDEIKIVGGSHEFTLHETYSKLGKFLPKVKTINLLGSLHGFFSSRGYKYFGKIEVVNLTSYMKKDLEETKANRHKKLKKNNKFSYENGQILQLRRELSAIENMPKHIRIKYQ